MSPTGSGDGATQEVRLLVPDERLPADAARALQFSAELAAARRGAPGIIQIARCRSRRVAQRRYRDRLWLRRRLVHWRSVTGPLPSVRRRKRAVCAVRFEESGIRNRGPMSRVRELASTRPAKAVMPRPPPRSTHHVEPPCDSPSRAGVSKRVHLWYRLWDSYPNIRPGFPGLADKIPGNTGELAALECTEEPSARGM